MSFPSNLLYTSSSSHRARRSPFDSDDEISFLSHIYSISQPIHALEGSSTASAEDLAEQINKILLKDPIDVINAEKIEDWRALESTLSKDQKKELSMHLFASVAFDDLPGYIALVDTTSMAYFLSNAFLRYLLKPENEDSRAKAKQFLDKTFEFEENKKISHPLLKEVLSSFVPGNYGDLIKDVFFKKFDEFNPLTAAYFVVELAKADLSLPANSITFNSRFLLKTLEEAFNLEEKPRFRKDIFKIILKQIDKNNLRTFFARLVSAKFEGLIYAHLVLDSSTYNRWMKKDSDFFELLLNSWSGGEEDKHYVLDAIKDNTSGRFDELSQFLFNIGQTNETNDDDDSDEDRISLNGFCTYYRDSSDEDLLFLKNTIQQIPPLLVALGIDSYLEFLVKLLPTFTTDQIEACCLNNKKLIVQEYLELYVNRLEEESLFVLLKTLGKAANPFLEKQSRELQTKNSDLSMRLIEWKSKCKQEMKEEIEDHLKEGVEIRNGLRNILRNPFYRYFRRIQSPSSPGDIMKVFNKVSDLINEQNKRKPLKDDIADQAFIFSDSGLEPSFSEGCALIFNQTILRNTGLDSFDPLVKIGIKNDEDLRKAGITPNNQESLNYVHEQLNKLGTHRLLNRRNEHVGSINLPALLSEDYLKDDEKFKRGLQKYSSSQEIHKNIAKHPNVFESIFRRLMQDFPDSGQALERLRERIADSLEIESQMTPATEETAINESIDDEEAKTPLLEEESQDEEEAKTPIFSDDALKTYEETLKYLVTFVREHRADYILYRVLTQL